MCATLLFAFIDGQCQAQDQAGSRDIKLNSGGGRSLQINQVDTSHFPKVDIFATVLEAGAPVTGLSAKDFRVREDEVEQEPLSVAAQLSPLSVVVTVDTSGSMSKAMQTAREAAQLFVDSLAPQDSVAVVSFNRTVQVLANPGTNREQAKQVIGILQARGDTALFDAMHASLDILKGRPGRKAIVLLSDGVDDGRTGNVLSKHSIDESLKLAQDLNVPVFTVGLGSELDEATLQRVATQSGASFYKAPTADQLKALYGQLGQQLTGQYEISYTSNLPGDGSVHNIQLGQASLRSNKAYSSPSNGAVAAQVVPVVQTSAPAPALAAVGSGPIELVAGSSPESAPLIQPDQLQEIPGKYDCDANPAISDNWGVSEENKGPCYLKLRRMEGVKMSLFSFLIDDAGSGRDAGESEASALSIPVGSTVSGVVREGRDQRDSYKVQLAAGGDYQVRVRPDLKTSLQVGAYDDEGKSRENKYSQNAGAGVTLDIKVASATSILVAVRHSGGQWYGKYSLVVGPQGVSAPSQPEEVAIPNRLNAQR